MAWSPFGVDDNVGKPAVEAAGQQITGAIWLLRSVLHGILTRVGGMKITLSISMPPENPPTNEDVQPN